MTHWKIKLCDEKNDRVHVHVDAEYNGVLKISGQDLGTLVDEVWGDSDYEYFYDFDTDNTQCFFDSLTREGPNKQVKQIMLEKFSGMNGCANLCSYCEQHGITFSMFSYA